MELLKRGGMMRRSKGEFIFYDLLTEKEQGSLKYNTYYKGDIIAPFRTIKTFYFILDGGVKFLKLTETQLIRSPKILTKGSIVGIIGFLIKNKNSDMVFAATDTCRVIEIPYEIIVRLKKESLEFNHYLIELLLKRGMDEWENLHIRSFAGIKGVIARYLIRNSINNYVYFDNVSETLKDLNISNNGFYRIIKQWNTEKIIEKNKNSIKILDKERLEKVYKELLHFKKF